MISIRLDLFAARTLSPNDLDRGAVLIEDTISKLRNISNLCFYFFAIFSVFFGFIAIASIFLLFKNIFIIHQSGVNLYYTTAFLSTYFLFLFSLRGVSWFQQRQRFFVKNPYDIALPDELDSLMYELRSGGIHAQTSVGYDEAPPPNAQRADDGTVLGWPIPPEIFANRYAPLLLSANPKSWSLFWLSFRKSITRPIYVDLAENHLDSETVAHLSSPEGDIATLEYDEPPCYNDHPDFDWLVGGSYSEFQTGLERFLIAEIPSNMREIYKIALTTARRELRKGLPRGALENTKGVIEEDLKPRFANASGLIPNFGRTTLSNLLRGQRSERDIRGYFLEARAHQGRHSDQT